MDVMQIKAWLLSTVAGVIILGAVGSLLAALFLFISKKIFSAMYKSTDKFLIFLFYPIIRKSLIANAMRDKFIKKSESTKFIIYYIDKVQGCIVDMMISLLSITLTLHVIIAYGLNRPMLLSSLITINILTLYAGLKSAMFSNGHVHDELEKSLEHITEQYPLKYKDISDK